VKIKFLQNYKKFIEFLYDNNEKGYNLIRDQMINILSQILSDKRNPKVIDLCCDCLVEVTKFIKDEDKGFHILTVVIGKGI
jgi:hypothetical protein